MSKKSSLWSGEPLGTLLSSFHALASRNPAAGLGQEAVHEVIVMAFPEEQEKNL